MAAVKIGSARRDENGKYSGGKAGDQDGIEVSEQSFYVHSKGWTIIRAKDEHVAKLQAEAMRKACNNNHIGYDQGNRDGLYVASKPYRFDPSAVKIDTETDCSALVRVCCNYAGVKVGDFYTGNEVDVLLATGQYKALDFVSADSLKLGDILVTKKKGHTVIVTEVDTVEYKPHWVLNDNWRYAIADGEYAIGWQKIKNQDEHTRWYYFDNNGIMQKGLFHVGNKRYYGMEYGALEGALCRTDESGALDIWVIE